MAAGLVTTLHAMVTRQFDIFDPVVLTVGSFHAGTKRNIIPAEATFDATVRSFSPAAREKVRDASIRLGQEFAAAHGLRAEVRYQQEYPVTVNDPGQAEFATAAVTEVFGADRFTPMPTPQAGAEDFSRVLERVPGCYLFLGACPGDDYDSAADNHSALAQFDDSVLADGCLLHASLAVRSLQAIAAGA